MIFRSNQRFLPLLPEKRSRKTHKNRKQSCSALLKPTNRYCKILWPKSTTIFKKQTRVPLKLNIEKKWWRQKKNNKSAILENFSPYRYEVNERSLFPLKKPQNQSFRGQITFGIQLQTFPSKCNTRKLESKTWNIAEKTQSNNASSHT